MFLLRDVLVLPDGSYCRLVRWLDGGSSAGLISLSDKKAQPFTKSSEWVKANCEQFVPTKHAGRVAVASVELHPSVAMQLLAQRAMEIVESLAKDPAIFDRGARARLILKRAEECDCSPTTVRLHLRRFLQGGCTLASLYGDFRNCATTERGHSPKPRLKANGERTYQLHEPDYKAMARAVETVYLKDKRKTQTQAYQRMLEDRYSYVDGNGKLYLLPPPQRPSFKQFEDFLRTKYPLEYRTRKRKGPKDYALESRHILSSVQVDCHGAGHRFEIDATIADVFCVSEADGKSIVGKPTLYLVIDRWTRLIVGFYLGYENPCFMAALEAILSICENKEEMCRKYGLEYRPEDWPAHEVQPEEFIADLGDMAGKNAHRISPHIGTMVVNVPGCRPDWKPLVECGIKLAQQAISMDEPSYDPPSNAKRRRGKAYYLDATKTLHEMASHFLAAIIKSNRSVHTTYPMNPEQVADGVVAIPVDLWTYECANHSGAMSRFTREQVWFDCTPRELATVTAEGIQIRKHLYYTFRVAEKRGWFVNARAQGRFKVTVSLDYRRCGEVTIHDPDQPGTLHIAYLTPPCQQFARMSFADVHRHFKEVARLTACAESINRQNQFEFNQHGRALNKTAKRRFVQATDGKRLSRKARRADTAPARKVALELERDNTVQMLGESAISPSQPASPATSAPTPRRSSLAARLAGLDKRQK